MMRWHREFTGHRAVEHSSVERYVSRRPGTTLAPHSHCPYCGNAVGEYTTACASCGHTFMSSAEKGLGRDNPLTRVLTS